MSTTWLKSDLVKVQGPLCWPQNVNGPQAENVQVSPSSHQAFKSCYRGVYSKQWNLKLESL